MSTNEQFLLPSAVAESPRATVDGQSVDVLVDVASGRAPRVLLDTGESPLRRVTRELVKRMLDVTGAVVALVVLAPLFVILALAIAATSRGPVIFRHERIGRHGRTFGCLKFRTMVDGADRMLAEMLEADTELREQYEADFKLHDDPRTTKVGRWLRRTSLDELPQFWNVLRGHMSLVGPRPVVADELPRYGIWQPLVLAVRPGLTGLWQVSGRNDLDYDQRVALDVSYVRAPSLGEDLRILLKTVVMVLALGRNGAY